MSGYNQNWRRRDRDSRGTSGRGSQNSSNFWNNNHYGNYQNYSQYPYSQPYAQQRNWSSQFQTSFSQRSAWHGTFTSGQQQQQLHGKNAQPHRFPSPGSDSSKQRSSSSSQSKTLSDPHPGSEEARKKTLAQTTDKIKSCLRSFQNEKSDVLENLLSGEETESITETAKGNAVTLEASGQELQLTPSDLKVIGMVNTSGLAVEEEDPGIPIETDAVTKETLLAEACEQDLNNEECTTDLLQNDSRNAKNKNPVSKEAVKLSAGSSSEAPVSDKSNTGSEQSSSRAQSACQGEAAHSTGSTEKIQIESAEMLQKLKQRIIQQFLKMGKNNLKDLLNNPRSRKFEFAMNHLMKEHRKVLSRELRGLAQSRIKGQESQVQSHVTEASSLLDTDVAINLSHLPQELIEQLGNLLQLDLLDNVSEEFQPNMAVIEEESKYNVMQNIETLQVALMSEDNIKKENIESDNTADFTPQNVASEKNKEEQNASMPSLESDNEALETAQEQVATDNREIVHEEGNVTNKTRKPSSDWCPYIPLGKGFMNRGEFGSLFCEFPDFMEMESVESEQEMHLKDQSEACDEPPPAEVLENVPLSDAGDANTDTDKEALEENLIADPETSVGESKEEENLRDSELDLPLNPFEDLQVPIIDTVDKQVTAASSDSGANSVEDTQLQEVPMDVCESSTVPECAAGTDPHDDTTKSILDLEETLARVDESVAGLGDNSDKQTESEGIEFDIPDTETENPCDTGVVNDDVLEGLRSMAENVNPAENVESASDMKENNAAEANLTNEEICETEAMPTSMDVDVSAMPAEQCSDVLPEHNVDFDAGSGNQAVTNYDDDDVNMNPAISRDLDNVVTAGIKSTAQSSGLPLEDEVTELYRHNIIVKTEVPDTGVQQRRTEEEPVQEMRHTTEIAVQTESSEELDSLNIEKFLHCLERSGQLSPHLTRLLKEQLSNKQVEIVEKEQAPLSTLASPGAMMLIPPASQHIMRASRITSGNKGRTRIRGGLRSLSEEVTTELQTGVQDLGSARNTLVDIGSSSVDCAGRNLPNPEDILPLPVRRESTAISKFVFLKMLEIDKEIQKLMELKLDLYRKLQVTLEMDPSSVDGKEPASTNSRDVVESVLSKEAVGSPNPPAVPAEQLRQPMHATAVSVNDADAEELARVRKKPLPSSSANLAPMVMLPMDYMLSHQSSQPPRQKLKTLDTLEAVLNSFDIPEQPPKEKEHTNTGTEETSESPSQNIHSSDVSASEVSIASETTNKKPSGKQSANKKKTNTSKKNTGKNEISETAMSLGNSGANEEVEKSKAKDTRRRKPEGKTKGRSARHKANVTDPEEDDEPLSGNSSLQETNKKVSENHDQELETPVKLKSRRGSETPADKAKNQRNKKEAEENVLETSVTQHEENTQPKTARNRRESRKTEVSAEEATEVEEQQHRKNDRKAEAEPVVSGTEEITNKKSRGSKQRAMAAINDALALDESTSKNSRKRKVSLKGDNLNESEQDNESTPLATKLKTRSPRKLTSDQESSQAENEITKKMKAHGGNEESPGKRSTRTSLSESGRRNSHSEAIEEATEVKRQTGLKRKAEEALGSSEKCQRVSKPDLKEVWNMPNCFVVVHPLAEEQIRSLSGAAVEIKDKHDDDDVNDAEQEKKEKKKPSKKRQSSKASARITHNVDVKENEPMQFDTSEERLEDPLGGIPDVSQPPELHSESFVSAVSSPLQSPPDLMVQSTSPRTNLSMQDENSISTLVSDSVSVNSDGEHSFVKKNPFDISSECKDDCDRDSLHSCDTGQELRDGAGSRSLKHKSSKRHKKDIERLTFEAHQGPILDIKTVGRHVLAASEDGFVYCYSLKSGKFKRKYGGHDSAVTCLCVVECCVEPDVSNELDAGEQMTPELFFTGSLDKNLRYFSFKTGELVQPPVNIGSPIQCMDQNWGILFIGTKIGEVIQYNIKSSSIIGEEPLKLGREAILSLKATKEGPRNVLIIGTRNKPITIRDASSGLLLRSINSSWSHTVYSLVLNANEVYCGTKNGFIPVIQFQNGEQICKFKTGAGVVCMRIYNNLLFAGCYDGNIYVFSIQDKKLISCIPGPGKMLLCLDIVKNRIIVGSKDGNKLEAWGFPQDVRNHVKEAKHR